MITPQKNNEQMNSNDKIKRVLTDNHVRPLRNVEHGMLRSVEFSAVNRPQSAQNPEQTGLSASVRTGYQQMLARFEMQAQRGANHVAIRSHYRHVLQDYFVVRRHYQFT